MTTIEDLEVGDYALFYLRDEQGDYSWGGTVVAFENDYVVVRHCHRPNRCDGPQHETCGGTYAHGPNKVLRVER